MNRSSETFRPPFSDSFVVSLNNRHLCQSGQAERRSFWAPREAMATIVGVPDTLCVAFRRSRRRRVAREPSYQRTLSLPANFAVCSPATVAARPTSELSLTARSRRGVTTDTSKSSRRVRNAPGIVAVASCGDQNDLRADSWFWVVFTNARQSGQPARSSFWAPREAMATISGVLDTQCAASGRTRRRRVASEPSG